jgi:hypothetical protein
MAAMRNCSGPARPLALLDDDIVDDHAGLAVHAEEELVIVHLGQLEGRLAVHGIRAVHLGQSSSRGPSGPAWLCERQRAGSGLPGLQRPPAQATV